ncbi:hypothetical protein C8R45DRAFT_607317 [Mycena sanguinolenta]|nr:hypothetical protein C8R45DRAFT_607317 [Mycena sanguinolenta]
MKRHPLPVYDYRWPVKDKDSTNLVSVRLDSLTRTVIYIVLLNMRSFFLPCYSAHAVLLCIDLTSHKCFLPRCFDNAEAQDLRTQTPLCSEAKHNSSYLFENLLADPKEQNHSKVVEFSSRYSEVFNSRGSCLHPTVPPYPARPYTRLHPECTRVSNSHPAPGKTLSHGFRLVKAIQSRRTATTRTHLRGGDRTVLEMVDASGSFSTNVYYPGYLLQTESSRTRAQPKSLNSSSCDRNTCDQHDFTESVATSRRPNMNRGIIGGFST